MKNSILIRKAVVQDVSCIQLLMKELGYSIEQRDLESRIAIYYGPDDVVLLAEDRGEVIGFLSFHIIPLFHEPAYLGRITAMSISSKRQREGVGKALLENLDIHARERGCTRIEVTSGDHRKDHAHLFYQSCGYVKDSRRFQKILDQ